MLIGNRMGQLMDQGASLNDAETLLPDRNDQLTRLTVIEAVDPFPVEFC